MFKTGQTPYNWQVTNFTRPSKENLVVYELLLRDFTQEKTGSRSSIRLII
jgi:pullulanase/glycogen debranching enzyme